MAILQTGNIIPAMLLNTDGSDGEVKQAKIASGVFEAAGRFSMLVIVEPGQDVAYAGQALQADFNGEKCRWQVMHPCA